MQRHIVDQPRDGDNARLPRYVAHERHSGVRGAHHAINVLRRAPRGHSDLSSRMRSYLRIERHVEA